LLKAMHLLPDRFCLRLVGRIAQDSDLPQIPTWLSELVNDPAIAGRVQLVPPVPVDQVAGEIDRCDILCQPASSHILTQRYASPLKTFDYMVRGKPILAADVPCHRELLQDGVNAVLYPYAEAEQLAARIISLAEQPRLAAAIAQKAWEQSIDNTYDSRARRILELAGEVWISSTHNDFESNKTAASE